MSMTLVAGAILAATPWQAATKPSSSPKSLRKVRQYNEVTICERTCPDRHIARVGAWSRPGSSDLDLPAGYCRRWSPRMRPRGEGPQSGAAAQRTRDAHPGLRAKLVAVTWRQGAGDTRGIRVVPDAVLPAAQRADRPGRGGSVRPGA